MEPLQQQQQSQLLPQQQSQMLLQPQSAGYSSGAEEAGGAAPVCTDSGQLMLQQPQQQQQQSLLHQPQLQTGGASWPQYVPVWDCSGASPAVATAAMMQGAPAAAGGPFAAAGKEGLSSVYWPSPYEAQLLPLSYYGLPLSNPLSISLAAPAAANLLQPQQQFLPPLLCTYAAAPPPLSPLSPRSAAAEARSKRRQRWCC